MKEIEKRYQDEQKEVRQKEISKELKYIGSIRKRDGHKTWQIDLITKEITEAKLQSVATFGKGIKHKLVVQQNCLYTTALNKKNAAKHFTKKYNISL